MHVIKHKRLYFTVALPGQDSPKFQHVPKGTQLKLTAKQVKGFGPRVGPVGGEVATVVDADADADTVKSKSK
jgi:hypothetical protein